MSVEDNKKIVLGFFENFTAGKPEEALGAMADNATWWVAGNFALSGTVTKQQFAEGLKGMAAALPEGLRLTPKGITAEGDRVAVEAESYGKHANGKIYQNQYHFLIEVRDGKIQAVREYLDTMHANDVLCS
jgi:ketosteroid isomerase-like protein